MVFSFRSRASKSLLGNRYKRIFVGRNLVGFAVVVIVVYVHKCARALRVMIYAKPSCREVISLQKVDSLLVFNVKGSKKGFAT